MLSLFRSDISSNRIELPLTFWRIANIQTKWTFWGNRTTLWILLQFIFNACWLVNHFIAICMRMSASVCVEPVMWLVSVDRNDEKENWIRIVKTICVTFSFDLRCAFFVCVFHFVSLSFILTRFTWKCKSSMFFRLPFSLHECVKFAHEWDTNIQQQQQRERREKVPILPLPHYPLHVISQCYQRAKRILYLLLSAITKVGSGRASSTNTLSVCVWVLYCHFLSHSLPPSRSLFSSFFSLCLFYAFCFCRYCFAISLRFNSFFKLAVCLVAAIVDIAVAFGQCIYWRLHAFLSHCVFFTYSLSLLSPLESLFSFLSLCLTLCCNRVSYVNVSPYHFTRTSISIHSICVAFVLFTHSQAFFYAISYPLH